MITDKTKNPHSYKSSHPVNKLKVSPTCQFLQSHLHFGNSSSQFLMMMNLQGLFVELESFLHFPFLRQKFCFLHQLVEANVSISGVLVLLRLRS